MSEPTDVVLQVSAQFTHSGVPGASVGASLAYSALVNVVGVLSETPGEAVQLEGGGLMLLEAQVTVLPAPVVTCAASVAFNGGYVLPLPTNPLPITFTLPEGCEVGDGWYLWMRYQGETYQFSGLINATNYTAGSITRFIDVAGNGFTGGLEFTARVLHAGAFSAGGVLALVYGNDAPQIDFPQDVNNDDFIRPEEYTDPTIVRVTIPGNIVAGAVLTLDVTPHGIYHVTVSAEDRVAGYIDVPIHMFSAPPIETPPPYAAPQLLVNSKGHGSVVRGRFTADPALVVDDVAQLGLYTTITLPATANVSTDSIVITSNVHGTVVSTTTLLADIAGDIIDNVWTLSYPELTEDLLAGSIYDTVTFTAKLVSGTGQNSTTTTTGVNYHPLLLEADSGPYIGATGYAWNMNISGDRLPEGSTYSLMFNGDLVEGIVTSDDISNTQLVVESPAVVDSDITVSGYVEYSDGFKVAILTSTATVNPFVVELALLPEAIDTGVSGGGIYAITDVAYIYPVTAIATTVSGFAENDEITVTVTITGGYQQITVPYTITSEDVLNGYAAIALPLAKHVQDFSAAADIVRNGNSNTDGAALNFRTSGVVGGIPGIISIPGDTNGDLVIDASDDLSMQSLDAFITLDVPLGYNTGFVLNISPYGGGGFNYLSNLYSPDPGTYRLTPDFTANALSMQGDTVTISVTGIQIPGLLGTIDADTEYQIGTEWGAPLTFIVLEDPEDTGYISTANFGDSITIRVGNLSAAYIGSTVSVTAGINLDMMYGGHSFTAENLVTADDVATGYFDISVSTIGYTPVNEYAIKEPNGNIVVSCGNGNVQSQLYGSMTKEMKYPTPVNSLPGVTVTDVDIHVYDPDNPVLKMLVPITYGWYEPDNVRERYTCGAWTDVFTPTDAAAAGFGGNYPLEIGIVPGTTMAITRQREINSGGVEWLVSTPTTGEDFIVAPVPPELSMTLDVSSPVLDVSGDFWTYAGRSLVITLPGDVIENDKISVFNRIEPSFSQYQFAYLYTGQSASQLEDAFDGSHGSFIYLTAGAIAAGNDTRTIRFRSSNATVGSGCVMVTITRGTTVLYHTRVAV